MKNKLRPINDRLKLLRSLQKRYNNFGWKDDIRFFIMALTHIRHGNYLFNQIKMSDRSNSIYLYNDEILIKRISDHYNGYGTANSDYYIKQGIILDSLKK